MRVPTYDNLQVGANTLPQPSFRPAAIDGASARPARLPLDNKPIQGVVTPDIAGKQLMQSGDQLQRMGQQMANMQIEAEKQVMQVRVDDALNKAKEAALRLTHDKDQGYTSLKGLNALERPDGKSLEDEYTENLVKEIRTIGEGLGTDAQRALFSQRASELATQFRAGVMRHSSDEYKTYQLSVAEGVQSTALNEIGLNYNNPEVVQGAVDRIKAQVYQQAKLTGKSAEWQEAKARTMTSSAHKVALMAALEKNDPEYAQGYLKKFSKDMEADDILQVRGLITKEMTARVGMTVAADVMQRVEPSVMPSDSDRAFNILIGTESGGRQFDRNGQPLTSSAGAIGIAQVMPTTGPEAAKLAGMKWDEQRYRTDPEYNRALGRAYFEQQLKDFDGRLDLAYAAYNAGPGRLKQAIGQARKQGGDWLDYMPEETQKYVAKNMREYETGKGKPKEPTFQEIDDALRSDPRLMNNPEAYKIARTDAERRFNDAQKARKQREEDAFNTALEMVEQNGGSYATLPLAVRNAIPPDKRDTVMTFADKVAKGQAIETDWNLYYELRSDPQKLAAVNLGTFKDKLADAEFKQLVDLQQPKDAMRTTVIRSAEEVVRSYMLQAGIDPADKSKDGAARAGQVFSEFEKRLNAFEVEQGKKATSKDAEQIAARMFTSVETYGRFLNSTKFAFEVGQDDQIVIPSSERRLIVDALRSTRRPVTEENILKLYRQQKGL